MQDSEVPKSSKPDAEVTLDLVPENNKYLKVKRLEEQGKQMFETLLQFQASPHISRYIQPQYWTFSGE